MEKAVAVSYTAPLRYSHQMHHDEPVEAKSSPELHPDHRDGANRMGRASTQCRSQYPRPSTCCATGSSGEVKWRHINRSNISIKDKHLRVRQLLKEDAGSGVRADDSGVGVFIIFVNIMTLASSPTNTIVIIIISILTMTITKVTPLHWAAINDRPDVVDLLLDCGADPNCKGSLLVLIVTIWVCNPL